MNLNPKNLKKDFLKFVFASVMAQWVFALYTAVDGLFVARGVSEVALAAVNIALPFTNLLFSVSLMFAAGTSTVVSMYMGQGRQDKANQAASMNIAVMAGFAAVLTAVVLLFPQNVAAFLGANEQTMQYVVDYITMIAPFSVFFVMSYAFEILLKADGAPRYATGCVVFGCVLNCVLDWLLVIVFPFGVKGAAFATAFSQFALVMVYLAHFLGKNATIRLTRFKMDWKDLGRIVRIGLPSGVTESSAGITTLLFNHMILRYLTNDALVSYTIIGYVNMIVVMGVAGIAQGAQPMIGYYCGSGDRGTVKRLMKYSLVSAMAMGVGMMVLSLLSAPAIAGIFISEQLGALRDYSAAALRVFVMSFLLMCINVVLGGFFSAVEKPGISLTISVGRGLVFIALALLTLPALFGGQALWHAATVSEALCLTMTCVLVMREKKNGTLFG